MLPASILTSPGAGGDRADPPLPLNPSSPPTWGIGPPAAGRSSPWSPGLKEAAGAHLLQNRRHHLSGGLDSTLALDDRVQRLLHAGPLQRGYHQRHHALLRHHRPDPGQQTKMARAVGTEASAGWTSARRCESALRRHRPTTRRTTRQPTKNCGQARVRPRCSWIPLTKTAAWSSAFGEACTSCPGLGRLTTAP